MYKYSWKCSGYKVQSLYRKLSIIWTEKSLDSFWAWRRLLLPKTESDMKLIINHLLSFLCAWKGHFYFDLKRSTEFQWMFKAQDPVLLLIYRLDKMKLLNQTNHTATSKTKWFFLDPRKYSYSSISESQDLFSRLFSAHKS